MNRTQALLLCLLVLVGVSTVCSINGARLRRRNLDPKEVRLGMEARARQGRAGGPVTPPGRKLIKRDVCVLGGGPSGLSFGAFWTELNGSVIVLEVDDQYGGNCNTEFFPGGWIDIGTAAFPNTTFLNLVQPADAWTIDSVAIANRFSGGKVIPITYAPDAPATPTYGINFATGQSVPIPPDSTGTAFDVAFAKLFAITQQYPWLDRAVRPSPIPAELLVSCSEWIRANDLQPLVPTLFAEVVDGNVDYDNTPALYCLIDVKPALLYILSANNTGFVIEEGCIQMYDGMVDYIGTENVLTGVTYHSVSRPSARENGPTRMVIQTGSGRGSRIYDIECDNVVAAFPQDLAAIEFLHPDEKESAAFAPFSFRYWAAVEFDGQGPLAAAFDGYTIFNWNTESPFLLCEPPCVQTMSRSFPFGPGGSYVVSKTYLTPTEVLAVWNEQTSKIPHSLLNGTAAINIVPHASYGPHAPVSNLAQHPNPYANIRELNEDLYRATIWISTTEGDNDTVLSWQNAYNAALQLKAAGKCKGNRE